MSGVSAKCYATKWHLCRGSNRNDVDDQKSSQSKPLCRPNVRASDCVFGLWFVFAGGPCARPPDSGALPCGSTCLVFICFFLKNTLHAHDKGSESRGGSRSCVWGVSLPISSSIWR